MNRRAHQERLARRNQSAIFMSLPWAGALDGTGLSGIHGR
jgi:hypothetical protein